VSPPQRRRILPSGLLLALLLGAVVVPSVLTLSVGIVALAVWQDAPGLVIGVLTLTFAASAIVGGVAAVIFLRRSARLAEMQADFVANVSHELRTPLAGLRLVAETFEAGRGDDPTRRAALVEMLGDEVRRLDALVARVLTWRRLDEGLPLAVRERVDLGQVVSEAVQEIRRLPDARSVILTAVVPDDPPSVIGDREMLMHAVANLVHNGVKFAGEHGPIEVTVRRQGASAVIAVRDHGPGLSQEARVHAFDRFYRAPEHRAHRAGTGLGLAIVKGIAEAHGGRVGLASAPGEGSTFSVWLPAMEGGVDGR